MTLSRRKMIGLIGGGAVLAATTGFGILASRKPQLAGLPWETAGQHTDPRHRALSYALLAPNPHNRQPWLADLTEPNMITLYADPSRLLPQTDPLNRQITIGLGCFLELLRMAAAEDGQRTTMVLFPDGSDPNGLDNRAIAQITFMADPATPRDPLFAQVLARRSNKEPFDTAREIDPAALAQLAAAVTSSAKFGGTLDPAEVAEWRRLTHDALLLEVQTPRTFKESVDLFRIGHKEVDANPDGIDFTGPLFESLHLAGLFTRDAALKADSMAYQSGLDALFANTDSAMGHVWLITEGNSRFDQIATGADWLRINLAATAAGLGFQPLSQSLQEFPEMAPYYAQVHERLAPSGGTVQMLARIGFGPQTTASPRWPLHTRLLNG